MHLKIGREFTFHFSIFSAQYTIRDKIFLTHFPYPTTVYNIARHNISVSQKIKQIMRSSVLSFLCLASVATNAYAFVSPVTSSAMKGDRDSSLNLLGKAYKVAAMANILGKDKEGNVISVPVKNIERDWSFEGFEGSGEFSVNLIVPEDRKVKGCAFFMHGFSQYPVAYHQMLKEACENAQVAVIAVETGVTSNAILKESINSRRERTGETPQFILQRALSEDTKQCIRMLKEGSDAFAEYGVTRSAVGNKIAVMGHSMGGGLSFPVAADSNLDYVFTMAPAVGEESFDPIKEGLDKRTPKNSMLLAGGWDLIAKAKIVEGISEKANSQIKNSSVYVKIARGLHTGFEDEVVLFSVPISSILKGGGLVGKILGLGDFVIFNILKVLKFVRTKTGQIEGSSILMSYFLSSMVAGKRITPENAEKYLDDNLKDRFEDKFDFSYGGAADDN